MKTPNELYDVLAVNIETDKCRVLSTGKTQDNAEAIVNMAVMRRGLDEEFFVAVPHGSHKEGGPYRPTEMLDDGFGNECDPVCLSCGRPTMQIVRPGKFQCANCG